MSLRTRLAAAGFAVALGLAPYAAPAQATAPTFVLPAAGSVCAVSNDSARQAADWLAAYWKDHKAQIGGGQLADAIIGMSASDSHPDVVAEMVAKLKTEEYPTYGAGPAGKSIIAVAAAGEDPTNFGGRNLLTLLKDAVADEGPQSINNLPYVILGYLRTGEKVPAALIDRAVTLQDKGGSWGYVESWKNPPAFKTDPDSSGVMISALAGLKQSGQGGDKVSTALDKALTWAKGAKTPGGYWDNYSPVNTTAMILQGYTAAGRTDADALKFLRAQQKLTGTGALSNVLDGKESNLMGTTQGLVALAEDSLLTVTLDKGCGAPSEPSSPASSADPSPSASQGQSTGGQSSSQQSTGGASTATATTSTDNGGRPMPETGR
ncbi:hypothetical protein M3G03_11465 [Aestuariimicrobium sp. p3-SID1156]|uniref:hypothetical protein n=1 Tax=Aestuariimicrobium sp. p3-SID1156 TaxID=2916038 RepID=UPI00223C3B60|nr:hypothetical protein [Aestuariimicrobium sp. p3-SID1156]MCT1460147.1 hypothetical protein [Aestuariimicrobium sp. p3-SID1156]